MLIHLIKVKKNCLQCNKIFNKKKNQSIKIWSTVVKYCSIVCSNKSKCKTLDNKERNCLYCETRLVKRVGKDCRLERPKQFYSRMVCNYVCQGKLKTQTKTKLQFCIICAKNFKTTIKNEAFCCSSECRNKLHTSKRIERKCFNCKSIFYATRWHVKNSPMKFCSSFCYGQSLIGEKGTHWKGGRKVASVTYSLRRRTMKAKNGGDHTSEQWLELKEKYQNMCLCCKKQEPEISLSRDHILPITKGGSNDISNIQPLCRSCNSKKNASWIDYRDTISRQYYYVL